MEKDKVNSGESGEQDVADKATKTIGWAGNLVEDISRSCDVCSQPPKRQSTFQGNQSELRFEGDRR